MDDLGRCCANCRWCNPTVDVCCNQASDEFNEIVDAEHCCKEWQRTAE